jgi:hypothetical protein
MEELEKLKSLIQGKGLSPEEARVELGRSEDWLAMVLGSDAWKYLMQGE